VWVDDDAFDHRSSSAPHPACRRREGAGNWPRYADNIASTPLDRSRPLWEMWVIEGVADTDPRRGWPLGRDDQGPSRRGRRGDRRPHCCRSCAPSNPTGACAGTCGGPWEGRPASDRGEWPGEVRLPSVAAGQCDANDRCNDREDCAPYPHRSDHGRAVRRPAQTGSTHRSPPTATSRWPSWTSTTSRRSRTASRSRSTTW